MANAYSGFKDIPYTLRENLGVGGNRLDRGGLHRYLVSSMRLINAAYLEPYLSRIGWVAL